jgi:hypothetical protein
LVGWFDLNLVEFTFKIEVGLGYVKPESGLWLMMMRVHCWLISWVERRRGFGRRLKKW